PWNGTGVTKNGAAGNVTNDGLGDWGSASTNLNNLNYMFARTSAGTEQGFATTMGQPGTNPAYSISAADTWEIKLAAWTLNITSFDSSASGDTRWGVTRIPATRNGTSGIVNVAVSQIDGLTEASTTAGG